MAGECLRPLGKRVAAPPFELLCDLQVQRRALRAEQPVVDRVAQQGMLEDVGPRGLVAVDEILRLEVGESAVQTIAAFGQRQNDVRVEPSPDHRRGLQEAPGLLRQPIDARRQDRVNALRQQNVDRLRVELDVFSADGNDMPLHEERRDFLGEQGVAVGFFHDQQVERVGQALDAKSQLSDARGLAARERIERDLDDLRVAEPGRRVARPSRQKKQQGGRRLGRDEPAQKFLGGAVDPVGVLDGDDERRQTRARPDDLVQKLARSEPDQDAVQRRERPARRLMAKQIEDEIAILVRLQADAPQAFVEPDFDRRAIVAAGDAKEAPRDVDEGAEGGLPALGGASPGHHERPIFAGAVAELVQQPRLPDARLAGYVEGANIAADLPNGPFEPVQFAFAADERGQAAKARGVEPRRLFADPVQSIDALGSGSSLDRMVSGELGVHQPLDETVGEFVEKNRSRGREPLQARGDVDRVAEDRETGRAARLQMAEHGGPGADADPDIAAKAEGLLDRVPFAREAFEDRQGGPARPDRRVLLRDRHAEHHHHAVAGDVLDPRAFGFNHRLDDARQLLDQAEGGLFAEALGKRGEADHVREENDNLATLRFQDLFSNPAPLKISMIGENSKGRMGRPEDADPRAGQDEAGGEKAEGVRGEGQAIAERYTENREMTRGEFPSSQSGDP